MLDACAAPGGKACHQAERHRVVAVDLYVSKLAKIEAEARRLGLTDRLEVLAHDATEPFPDLGGVDAVLLDAPCTGLGTLRRHPELRWRRSEEDVLRLAALQRRILERCQEQVPPGGPAHLRGLQHRARGGPGPGGALPPQPSRLHRRAAGDGRAAGMAGAGRAISGPCLVPRAWTGSSLRGCGASPERAVVFDCRPAPPGRKMPRAPVAAWRSAHDARPAAGPLHRCPAGSRLRGRHRHQDDHRPRRRWG